MGRRARWLVVVLLGLWMAVGLIPGTSLAAYTDESPYESLKNTTTVVRFDDKEWYLTDYDNDTVTLLSKECVAASAYCIGAKPTDDYVPYINSTVKVAVDAYYTNKISLGAKAYVVDNEMFLLSYSAAQELISGILKCSQPIGAEENTWWLGSKHPESNKLTPVVWGFVGAVGSTDSPSSVFGVRPALRLKRSSISFSTTTNTFNVIPCEDLKNNSTVVRFDNKDWYLADYDDSTVTLLMKVCLINSVYDEQSDSQVRVKYDSSKIKKVVDTYYADVVSANARTAVVDDRMFLLTADQARTLNENIRKQTGHGFWWTSSLHEDGGVIVVRNTGPISEIPSAYNVENNVRPALKLNRSLLTFTSETNTFDVKPTEVVTYQMLRLYNPNSGEHFYTASAGERDLLVEAGWRYEGEAWIAPEYSSTPVYRLYNKNGGDHHYTTSSGERDLLVMAGWSDEGTGWYSDDDLGVAVYRLYNPNADTGSHHFTTSPYERDLLVSVGWNDEGVAFYGVA